MREELASRLGVRQARVEALERRALWLTRLQFALFAATLAVGWAACDRRAIGQRWMLVPVGAFVVAQIARTRTNRARDRARSAAGFYADALARVDGTWRGGPDRGERYAVPEHPYAADLDLFGEGSLYASLCTPQTEQGRDTLAGWLSAPAAAEEVRARQAAVAELAPALDLRESLAEGGAQLARGIQARSLLAWAAAPPVPIPPRARAAAWALTAMGAVVLGLLITTNFAAAIGVGLVQLFLVSRLRVPVGEIGAGIDQRSAELVLLRGLVLRLERATFQAPMLVALKRELAGDGGPPALRLIGELARLVGWFESRRNPVFGIPTAPLMVGAHLALSLEGWRRRNGAAVARWIRAAGAAEALASLGALSYENPGYPFPTLAGAAEGPLVRGEAVGHPLIPAGRRVANDVELGGGRRLLLVSGSNMSGKSTYLRTIGVNVVLALAGAPVCARSLRLSALNIGATLRVGDSLQEGRSRFFAEITRIKQIVDLADRGPTLFLLDEVLAGTNSHDRRLGAEGVIAGLLRRGAIGVTTTHDLALTQLAGALGRDAVNVHFEDRIEEGELIFDYRLRDGVVTRSNALDLMRLVGLDVAVTPGA